MHDYLVRGIVENRNCRIFTVDTKGVLEQARTHHNLWPTASAALGRLISITFMMASMNKNEEKMTITINGGGPIGTMMTVTNGNGKLKGFVSNPEVHYTYNDTGKLAVGVAVGNQGTIQVIRDMGLREPFCGSTPLQSGEIGDDFSYYFAVSDQVNSAVSVGVLVDETNEILSSGGFIIQLLPDATEEDITFIEKVVSECKPVSTLLNEGMTPEEIIQSMFEEVSFLDRQELSFECDCSKEKMEKALVTVGSDELQSMIDEDHGCNLHCHFCSSDYSFSEEELQTILNTI